MDTWIFKYNEYKPEEEKLMEALCTLGNGYFATRGAGCESNADNVHYPGTYLAGGYNRLKTDIKGKTIENEDLVNIPNWLPFNFRIEGGAWFSLDDVEIIFYSQELHLRKGLLIRMVHFKDSEGRETKLENRRLVSMRKMHCAAQKMTLIPVNWSGRLEIMSAIDGKVTNRGVKRYSDLNSEHLKPVTSQIMENGGMFLEVRTNQSNLHISQSALTRVKINGESVGKISERTQEPGYVSLIFDMKVARNEKVEAEKLCSLYTSRDKAISECGHEARKIATTKCSFDDMLKEHTRIWDHIWNRYEIKFTPGDVDHGNEEIELVLRLYTFHLVQTSSIHTMDIDVGVPSRGWHGEAYRGHIFWDELFIFPILNFRTPEITRALMMYRYRRLDEAIRAARQDGKAGAMYPWQSGSNGREESQKIHYNPKSGRWIPDNSRLQRHVGAAIAYNLWHYYQVTQDMEFLSFYGARMLLEIARFWASLTEYNEKEKRYEIRGVMGPDEYHDGYPDSQEPGLNNNAYTNIMAVWVLRKALEVLEILPGVPKKEITENLNLTDKEKRRWKDITKKMKIPFHGDGIISQFEGYDELEEFAWEEYREKYGDIQRLDRILEAEDDSPNRYKLSKQADVLMLFYLFSSDELRQIFEDLGYSFEYETIPKNVDYYLKRTSHGSTLSRVVHSWVMARSDREGSWELFKAALQSDVSDIQGGTTPEGIHLGAMTGTVDILQRAYMGLELRKDTLYFDPVLPKELKNLHMHLQYRSHSLEVNLTPERLNISSLPSGSESIRIGFRDEVRELRMGDKVFFEL